MSSIQLAVYLPITTPPYSENIKAFPRIFFSRYLLVLLLFLPFSPQLSHSQDPLSSFGVHSLDMTQSNPYLNPTPLATASNNSWSSRSVTALKR